MYADKSYRGEKMKLDITYIKKEAFYCIEKIIATISVFLGRNYEMIFCNNIKSYNVFTVEELIGKLTEEKDFDTRELVSNLELYHGIEFYKYECKNFLEAFDFISNELKQNRPVIVQVDIFSLPWLSEKDYMYYKNNNINGSSVLIIIGIEREILHCFDAHYSNCENVIPFDNLKEGIFLDRIAGIRVKEKKYIIEKNKCTLNDKMISFCEKNEFGLNVFEQIRLLGKELNTFEVYKGDIKRYGYRQLCYLKGCINKIYRSRYLFSFALEYMANVLTDEKLEKYVNYYKEVVSVWYSIYLFAVKINMTKAFNEKNIETISNNIHKASIKEEEIIKAIIGLGIADINYKRNVDDLKEKKSEYFDSMYVPLDRYFNNNSFICAFIGSEKTEFLGEYLSRDEYSFKMSKTIYNTEFDNISCMGQIIEIPTIKGYRIKILGYGEDGNFSGVGKLIYSNGVIDEFVIELSRFERKKQYDVQYGSNQIMWESDRNNEEYDMGTYVSGRLNMRILAMQHPLNELYQLKQVALPNISNIHILAITIDKRKDSGK